jgi:hypothetical protein
MATLHSVQSGDFTTSTTWGLVNATSAVLTYTSQGFPATTPTASPTFTPGVITVQGISLHISNRSTPIGTFTVELFNATTTIVVATVTINVTDLFANNGQGNAPIGWVYFKFATPVTTVAAQLYSVRLNTSAINQVVVNFLTTAQNWTKVLVTTTNQAPAATDVLIIAGQHTAAGTNATYSVTMNNTNTTAFGNLFVSSKGTLIYATASSTNYVLRLAGNLLVQYFGTLQIGSVSDPIPVTSTATLEILCTTALQFTIIVFGTMTTYGTPKTIATKLAENVIVGATNSTTSTTTNWNNGDLIVVPSTTRTYTQYELKTLSATASGTTLTHNAYTNAHGGSVTNRVQADVVNLTRNVIIRSATGTLLTNKTNIQMRDPSITSFFYTAFLALGTGTTNTNSGICVTSLNTGTIPSQTGSFNFQYNVVREIVTQAATTTAATGLQTDNTANGINISNNIFYLLGWTTIVGTTILASINDNNYFMGCLATTQIVNANFAGSGNVFTSNNTPASINAFYNNSSDCSFYSNNTVGLSMALSSSLTTVNNNLSNFRFWANNTNGMQLTTTANTYDRRNILSFTGSYFFGNTTASINVLTRLVLKVYFSNSFFYGFAGATGQQTIHFIGSAIPVDSIYYDSCYFGYSNSSLTSAPFGGVNLSLPTSSTYQLFNNCYFNTANGEISVLAGYPYTNLYGGYRSLSHNGVTGSNKEWTPNGTITTDTTIFLSTPESTRLTPNSSVYKLMSPIVRVPVKSGNTCTVSVNVRRSVVGDGTAYNGNQPRLMYVFNPILGNLTETIGATYPDYNLLTQPETLSTMVLQRTTLGTLGISPSGLTNAYPIIVNDTIPFAYTGAAGTNIISTSFAVFSGTRNFSVYVKTAGLNIARVMLGAATTMTGTQYVDVNLNTGAIISVVGGTNAAVETLSNGWYRVSLDVTSVSATNNRVGVAFSDTVKTTGNGVDGVYVWGLQLTDGSGIKPYIAGASWQTLSYTTATFSTDAVAEFYVDCDGLAGWINIDDWNTTTANDSRGQDYWGVSGVYIEPTYRNPTRASGYIN